MFFRIIKCSKKSRARLGEIKTDNGVIKTPAFIPVGTQATVKGITHDQLKKIGVQAVLANTYHLYLRPGDELVKKFGGLHKFMNWDGPIFTDSGGFQAFSLGYALEHGAGKIGFGMFPEDSRKDEKARPHKAAHQKLARVTEDGVEFRSHLDGSKHFFTPEKSIKIQKNLGADIIFAFDECTSPLHSKKYTAESLRRTHRWAVRCLEAAQSQKSSTKNQRLFGIVQGGAYRDLREMSARFIGAMEFEGFGIGGSLGKSKEDMYKVLDWTIPLLPDKKPRHLLGIGLPEDIEEAVKRGVDTFDCVAPTRLGRNGSAFISGGSSTKTKSLNVKSSRFLDSKNPIDKNCKCYTCTNFKLGYITHLFKADEMLGPILVTIHNLYFMEQLMKNIREKIKNGRI